MAAYPHDGLDPFEFRDRIIRPTLHIFGAKFETDAAVNLLLGTAIQETNLDHLKQLAGGPAAGLYQIEPATHEDLIKTYFFQGLPSEIIGRQNAERRRRRALYFSVLDMFRSQVPAAVLQLEGSLFYQTAVARFIYWRVPKALPDADDIPGLAAYWKKWWNTPLGKGTVAQYIKNWKRAMG